MPRSDLLTVGEAASYLHRATSTIRRWADLGYLPCERSPQGGERRFRLSDLEDLRASMRGPKKETAR